MKLILKVILILSFFVGFQSYAYMGDYVSVFKPAKKNNASIAELQSNIKKDMSKIRAMINLQGTKKVKMVVGVMEDGENLKVKEIPADI